MFNSFSVKFWILHFQNFTTKYCHDFPQTKTTYFTAKYHSMMMQYYNNNMFWDATQVDTNYSSLANPPFPPQDCTNAKTSSRCTDKVHSPSCQFALCGMFSTTFFIGSKILRWLQLCNKHYHDRLNFSKYTIRGFWCWFGVRTQELWWYQYWVHCIVAFEIPSSKTKKQNMMQKHNGL